MNRYKCILFVLLFVIPMVAGCSSTYKHSFKASHMPKEFETDQIICLPLLVDGIPGDEACILESEQEIDEALSDAWEDRYVSISQSRSQYRECISPIIAALSNNQDQYFFNADEFSLEVNDKLCTDIMERTQCRYVVIPRMVSQKMVTQSIMSMGWFVPLGPVIVYGVTPIPLNSNPDQIPVFILTLLDLKTKTVLAQELYASKENMSKDCLEYPTNLISQLNKIK